MHASLLGTGANAVQLDVSRVRAHRTNTQVADMLQRAATQQDRARQDKARQRRVLDRHCELCLADATLTTDMLECSYRHMH